MFRRFSALLELLDIVAWLFLVHPDVLVTPAMGWGRTRMKRMVDNQAGFVVVGRVYCDAFSLYVAI